MNKNASQLVEWCSVRMKTNNTFVSPKPRGSYTQNSKDKQCTVYIHNITSYMRTPFKHVRIISLSTEYRYHMDMSIGNIIYIFVHICLRSISKILLYIESNTTQRLLINYYLKHKKWSLASKIMQ